MHGTHEEHCQCGCSHEHHGHDHDHHHDHEECCCGHDHDHEECCCGHDHDHHHHHQGEGCTCGCGGHHEESESEYKHALTYMLSHMTVHAAEIREIAVYMKEIGEEEASAQALKAVEAYEKANMRLNMAISLSK